MKRKKNTKTEPVSKIFQLLKIIPAITKKLVNEPKCGTSTSQFCFVRFETFLGVLRQVCQVSFWSGRKKFLARNSGGGNLELRLGYSLPASFLELILFLNMFNKIFFIHKIPTLSLRVSSTPLCQNKKIFASTRNNNECAS